MSLLRKKIVERDTEVNIEVNTVWEPTPTTTGFLSAVCSPSSADSSESAINDSEINSWSISLPTLGAFEKTKIFELVKANESMIESNNEDDDGAALRYQDSDKQSLLDVINMTDIAIRRLIKMSKRIEGFKHLQQEDQIALLKGSCFEVLILRAVTHYNPEKDCWRGPCSTMIKVDVLKEARGNSYEEIKSFIDSFQSVFRQDEALLLLMGAIVLFHPDRPNLTFPGQIRAEQCLYYYLLRAYIQAKYGSMLNPTDIEDLYNGLVWKVDHLHVLNNRHISMFLEVNPKEVEPLLIEIFDLKAGNQGKQ